MFACSEEFHPLGGGTCSTLMVRICSIVGRFTRGERAYEPCAFRMGATGQKKDLAGRRWRGL